MELLRSLEILKRKYQRALASMIYKFLDYKTKWAISVIEQLVEELHKPVMKKFKKRKIYGRSKYIIWAEDLARMESLSSMNKNLKYLSCIIDVVTKCTSAKTLKDKKGKIVLNAF